MSEPTLADDLRARTLARFQQHRQAWQSNEALRALYERWYGLIREQLPPPALGPWIELGSGPGFARTFIPQLQLSDVVQAPWHDRQIAAESLPFQDASVGAVVLFDVLHHLPSPRRFFAEATRVLRPGGRVVLCEPYVSWLSYGVYRLFHEEPVDMSVHPLAEHGESSKDPFDANQAIPTLLFERRRAEFEREFPALKVTRFQRLAGLAYPASGGFSQRPLLPVRLWRALAAVEDRLPAAVFRAVGFRLLAVIERV